MSQQILVTGASTGLGFAIAKDLGELGFKVLAGARKQEDLDRLGRLSCVEPLSLDVTSASDIKTITARLKDGSLLGLINNAGIAKGGPWEVVSDEDLHMQFAVNVFGVAAVTRAALPALRAAKGRIINISSISGKLAAPFLGPYAASKFALEAMTDSLRRELRPLGVKVISINPGPIKTPIWEKAGGLSGVANDVLTTEDLKAAYGPRLEKFSAYIKKAAAAADPIEAVTCAVRQALSSERPKTRYYVGKQIRLAAFLATHLSDNAMDRFLKRT